MNCKVCGNAVNDADRICNLCGNDLEAQRRERTDTGGYAPPQAFREEPSPAAGFSLAQEKEEAINRILYDGDRTTASTRLEERRRRRQEERAESRSGFPSFFSHERKEAAVPETPEVPAAPEAEAYAASAASAAPSFDTYEDNDSDDRPRRTFSGEFVFGNKPASAPAVAESDAFGAPQYATGATWAPAPEPAFPGQQTFAVPEPATESDSPGAQDPAQAFTFPGDVFGDFIGTPKDAFEPAPVPGSAFEPVSAPQSDSFFALNVTDEEQAKLDVDKKNEEFQELLDSEFEKRKSAETASASYVQDRINEFLREPVAGSDALAAPQEAASIFAAPSFAEAAMSEAPAPTPPPAPAFAEPAPAPAAPIAAHDPFAAVRVPAPEEGFAFDGKDYAHGFMHGEAALSDFDKAKIAYNKEVQETETVSDISAFGAPDMEFEAEEAASKQAASYAALEMFDFAPVAAESENAGVPQAAPPPAESAAPAAQQSTPWGRSRNEAPTRETVAAFLDRPVDFPFDEKPLASAAAQKEAAPIFDFEPLAEASAAPAAPDAPAPAYQPPAAPLADSDTSGVFAAPAAPAAPDAPAPAYQPPAAPLAGIAAPDASAPAFAAPFSFDAPGVFETPVVPEAPAALAAPETSAPAYQPIAAPLAGSDNSGAFAAPVAPEGSAPAYQPLADPFSGSETAGAQSSTPPLDFVGIMAEMAAPSDIESAAAPHPASAPVYQPQSAPAVQQPAPATTSSASIDEDGPPEFYKEYTQGIPVAKIEAAAAAKAEEDAAPEDLPAFVTAYDEEPLGKTAEELSVAAVESSPSPKGKADAGSKKARQSEAKRRALSVIITILIIILVLVVASIVILQFMPTSLGATYIRDAIGLVQEKLGIGGA